MKEIITVKEAAKFLKKHPDTIRHWIQANILPARKIVCGKNGVFVLLRNDILELMVSGEIERKTKELKLHKKKSVKSFLQVRLPI